MIRIALTLLLLITAQIAGAQHIQYRDKKKPVAKTEVTDDKTVPLPERAVKETRPDTTAKPVTKAAERKVVEDTVTKRVAVAKDTVAKRVPIAKDTVAKRVAVVQDTSLQLTKTKAAFTMNPRPKKPYVEDQNMCDLMSRPEVAPTLPMVINNVSPEMVKMLKERYQGRLYSITGLNMFDQRLKYKLKVCDRNLGKFRSEYLDKDGNVVTDPDFDYD